MTIISILPINLKSPTPASIDDFWGTLENIVSPYEDEISGIAIACPGEIK
ncbi:MAG: hypothetical protein ACLUCE_06415 [Streptococcus sp.]